ncbi:hypothetical protein DRE_07470 [Drechslerella stenobrocha 248]|uniref:Uncharacterized protein n=1 Tax=Drechslerella stenobrocha 248 TaxID=1043628 RepID=W7HV34_9PEZI|nr:hypothetical protein DRE_07470 [Drechslerella stenobrocha 248]
MHNGQKLRPDCRQAAWKLPELRAPSDLVCPSSSVPQPPDKDDDDDDDDDNDDDADMQLGAASWTRANGRARELPATDDQVALTGGRPCIDMHDFVVRAGLLRHAKVLPCRPAELFARANIPVWATTRRMQHGQHAVDCPL